MPRVLTKQPVLKEPTVEKNKMAPVLYHCLTSMALPLLLLSLLLLFTLYIETLECTSAPCLNEGTCFEGTNSYFCFCQPGFTGVNCEICECQIKAVHLLQVYSTVL